MMKGGSPFLTEEATEEIGPGKDPMSTKVTEKNESFGRRLS